MNKGIIIGISIAIIIGIGVIVVSSNYSDDASETSLSEETSETLLSEETKPKPKQFTVGLEESVGVSGG